MMVTLRQPLTALVGLALVLSISACATPKALRNLTQETGDNAIALSVALSRLEKQSRETAEARAAGAARLTAELARLEHSLSRTIAMVEAYESPEAVADYKAVMKDLADNALPKAKLAGESSQNVKDEIVARLKPLDSDAKTLRQVGVELLKFSKEDGRFDRVRFFVKFVKAVLDDVKKAREAGEKAKGQATEATKKAPANAEDAKP